jgi:hypothetical protein
MLYEPWFNTNYDRIYFYYPELPSTPVPTLCNQLLSNIKTEFAKQLL